ncbi:hypothetical protein AFI02nite_38900 [Aliivibrio fischeri]|uniref:Single Cache domain-containing protein n=1 Tax=Aliivibrio fischeri TaxID=668 RepID=A0A510UML7_ALIFS|nr:hypothetical protein AFI02nite_38900 [Aliivibrio fischeri]
MNFSIKIRLYLLAILPIVLTSALIMAITYKETKALNQVQMNATRSQMMDMKRAELKSYIEIISSELTFLLKKESKESDIYKLLASVKFDNNGYLFGLKSNGTRTFHPVHHNRVGENIWNKKDEKGSYYIQEMISAAKNGSDTPRILL